MSRVFLSFFLQISSVFSVSSLFSCMLPPFCLYLHLEGVLPTAFRVFSFVTVCYTILSTAFLSFNRTPDFVHRLAVIYASLRLFLRLVGPLCGVFRLFCMLPAFFFISQPTRRLVYCIRSVLRPSPFLIIFFTVFLCFSKLMTILFCLSSLMFDLCTTKLQYTPPLKNRLLRPRLGFYFLCREASSRCLGFSAAFLSRHLKCG